MENLNSPDQTPAEDGRARLKRLAEEAAARNAATVEAATTHLSGIEQAALAGLAKIAEEVRDLPPQNQDTLGPLWPGNQQ